MKKHYLKWIYEEVRWIGDVAIAIYNNTKPITKNADETDLIGTRPPKRP